MKYHQTKACFYCKVIPMLENLDGNCWCKNLLTPQDPKELLGSVDQSLQNQQVESISGINCSFFLLSLFLYLSLAFIVFLYWILIGGHAVVFPGKETSVRSNLGNFTRLAISQGGMCKAALVRWHVVFPQEACLFNLGTVPRTL